MTSKLFHMSLIDELGFRYKAFIRKLTDHASFPNILPPSPIASIRFHKALRVFTGGTKAFSYYRIQLNGSFAWSLSEETVKNRFLEHGIWGSYHLAGSIVSLLAQKQYQIGILEVVDALNRISPPSFHLLPAEERQQIIEKNKAKLKALGVTRLSSAQLLEIS